MDEDKVVCQECNVEFEHIIPVKHLIETHGMTSKEYKLKYPNNSLQSDYHRAKIAESRKKSWDIKKGKISIDNMKTENLSNVVEDISAKMKDNIEPIIKNKSRIEELDITVNVNQSYKEFPGAINIPKGKLNILNKLISITNIKIYNNYFITKLTINKHMVYNIVTDIAIPELKIDLEFPNAFWHNSDSYVSKTIRDKILIEDGWKVVNFKTPSPTVDELKEIFDITK